MTEAIIEIREVTVKSEDKILLNDISFSIRKGEAWAITGPSGSGKTILGKLLAGFYPLHTGQVQFHLPDFYKRIFVSQQHDFRYLSSSRSYYQQRFDSNYGNDFPLVKEALQKKNGKEDTAFANRRNEVLQLLNISSLMENRLIELSNGEGKRVQLAQALLQEPQILILDNPFIGLDKETRNILRALINTLIEKGLILFLITTAEEIPEAISHVLEMNSGRIGHSYERKDFSALQEEIKDPYTFSLNKELLGKLNRFSEEEQFSVAIEMKEVTVAYEGKIVLDKINWKVKKGERWALRGPNGSGKSTLLSLITADNPKAYTNDICLFDRKRGSGESIWDIKKKIGQISPELHIYFQRNTNYTEALSLASGGVTDRGFSSSSVSCFEVVCSGYYDQVGSSHPLVSLQYKHVEEWMELLQLSAFRNQPLSSLSLGQQRLVLLARALVKNPPLLILDEPCQGLDPFQTRYFIKVVDELCRNSDKTLIYVSHYPEDIPSCVDKVLMLENGKAIGSDQ